MFLTGSSHPQSLCNRVAELGRELGSVIATDSIRFGVAEHSAERFAFSICDHHRGVGAC
jgi:hypothetical protein